MELSVEAQPRVDATLGFRSSTLVQHFKVTNYYYVTNYFNLDPLGAELSKSPIIAELCLQSKSNII